MKPNVELILDAQAIVGEGVSWDAQRQVLLWVDILAKEVHLFDPEMHSDRRINVGQYVGAAVRTSDGDLLLAMHHGFARLNLRTEHLTPISDPEAHLPGNRFNDGKCDPAGRFWAGTMQIEGQQRTGALYRMDADLTVHKMLDGVGVSNGLAWSRDCKTMYYIDTAQSEVSAFDYDLKTGAIANRKTAVAFSHHDDHPDGMTIDEDGMLWVAFFGGGRVGRCDPASGKILDEIRFPVSLTTNCTFGGPNLDTLYVSSCRYRLSDEDLKSQPHAGGLFSAKPGVRGLPATPFRSTARATS